LKHGFEKEEPAGWIETVDQWSNGGQKMSYCNPGRFYSFLLPLPHAPESMLLHVYRCSDLEHILRQSDYTFINLVYYMHGSEDNCREVSHQKPI
jgi:hypothetical protein